MFVFFKLAFFSSSRPMGDLVTSRSPMAIEAASLAVVTHGLFARVKTGRVREGPGERGPPDG